MLKRLADMERRLLLAACGRAPQPQAAEYAEAVKAVGKHIYLVLGEPRTGKTTLASLAGISRAAMHVDTDAYPDGSGLLEGLADGLEEFHGDPNLRVCLITVGRHRKSNDAVLAAVVGCRKLGTNVTVCRLEKID